MHHGRLQAVGTPTELKARVVKATDAPDATLEDVFRHWTGDQLAGEEKGGLRSVRVSRRTARRMG
jgi:ABC-2 type transport system ATP-binding protein